jgi:hypothetical protein
MTTAVTTPEPTRHRVMVAVPVGTAAVAAMEEDVR